MPSCAFLARQGNPISARIGTALLTHKSERNTHLCIIEYCVKYTVVHFSAVIALSLHRCLLIRWKISGFHYGLHNWAFGSCWQPTLLSAAWPPASGLMLQPILQCSSSFRWRLNCALHEKYTKQLFTTAIWLLSKSYKMAWELVCKSHTSQNLYKSLSLYIISSNI